MADCTFCRIAITELDASLVYEGTLTIAFLDIHPINPGHTLVIPRRHVASFTELGAAEAREFVASCSACGESPQIGFVSAAQASLCLWPMLERQPVKEVLHAHLHVIPRLANDQFGWKRVGTTADYEQMKEIASRIRSALTSPDDRDG